MLLCAAVALASFAGEARAQDFLEHEGLTFDHAGTAKLGFELSSLQLAVAWMGLPPLSTPNDRYSFTIPVAALPAEVHFTKNFGGFVSLTYSVAGAGSWHSGPQIDSRFFMDYLGLTGGACIGRVVKVGAVVLYPNFYASSPYQDWLSSVYNTYWRKIYLGMMASIGYSGRSFFAGFQVNERFSPDPGAIFLPRFYLSMGVGYYFSTLSWEK